MNNQLLTEAMNFTYFHGTTTSSEALENIIWLEDNISWVKISNKNRAQCCHPTPRYKSGKVSVGNNGRKINENRLSSSIKVINRETGKKTQVQINRLVYQNFFPMSEPLTKSCVIDYIDGNKRNNSPHNLYRTTMSQILRNKRK